jgi:hypothetical protein
MAGGLIQLVSYGSQDIFLTGTPQITFFKMVYRRHTNFAMESVEVPFDDPVGFGKKSTITIPKVGDLIHKTYLSITLPEINFTRLNPSGNIVPVRTARDNYEIVTNFMGINRNAYAAAYDLYIAQNTTDSGKLITAVNSVFNGTGNETFINNFINLLASDPSSPYTYNEVSMQAIVNNYTSSVDKSVIFSEMSLGLDKSIITQEYFYNLWIQAQNTYNDDINANIEFAWVSKVGLALIDQIEIHIGGQKVDRHFGDWLNIWHELSCDNNIDPSYNKMIGQVPILTTFDRTIKPTYKLRIPLEFWFCRFSGLAIPLVALEYHDVRIEIIFRNIEDVSYVEDGLLIQYNNTQDGIYLADTPSELGVDIDATLEIDYIYLDSGERRRFAQSSHEYLIEQLQLYELNESTNQEVFINLDNFVHPSKELIWIAQKVSYTENLDGWTQTMWDNYSMTTNYTGNPINYSSLDFNSFNRVLRLDSNYFNYVQPYQYHTASPSDGINVYSFSLFPEEYQPSGGANLSRLSRVILRLELDPTLYPEDGDATLMNIRVYTRNINVLRLASGLAGLAFTYG